MRGLLAPRRVASPLSDLASVLGVLDEPAFEMSTEGFKTSGWITNKIRILGCSDRPAAAADARGLGLGPILGTFPFATGRSVETLARIIGFIRCFRFDSKMGWKTGNEEWLRMFVACRQI